MNKTFKTIALSLVIVTLLIAGGFALYKLSQPAQQPAEEQPQMQPVQPVQLGAILSFVEGEVKYKEPQGEWQKAEADTNLKEGYSVEVPSEGKAIINLDDGSAVRLNSESSVTLTSLKPDNIVVTLEKGQAYTRVVKAERIFQVKANDITYESVGTAYKTANTEEKKGVEVYQSKVKITEKEKEKILVEEGKKYYLKNILNPKEENTVIDLTEKEIKADKFAMWNKEKDEENEEYKKELGVLDFKAKEEEETKGEITLSGSAVDNGVKLTWTVSTGLDVSKGYKVLKSVSINPIFPGSNYQYVSNPAQKSLVWNIIDGKTYYFRVCQFLGDKCGVYSNNVKLTAPTKTKEEETTGGVASIILSSSGGGKVSWGIEGYAAKGYKLIWSKTTGPTFPTRSGDKYQYISNPETKSGTITAFAGSGKYYVRVCEYLGSKCGVYSNQIDVNLEGEEPKDESEDSDVNSISLSSGGGGKVNWSVDGYAEKGFKVVWSKTSGPTYPTRSKDKYQYLSNPEARSATIDAFDGGGAYYVRVCEYLGGSCGVYSNEIQVEL